MKTQILMKRDDFLLNLTNDFDGSSINVLFIDEDIFYDGKAVIYKNLRLIDEPRFCLLIGYCLLMQRKAKSKSNFYFRDELGTRCIRKNNLFLEDDFEKEDTDIFLLYEEKINSFPDLYQRIKDKAFFKRQFISIYPDYSINEENKLLNEEDILRTFLLRYIDWESCFYYIKSNICLENVEKFYPEVKSICLSNEEKFEIIESWKEGFDLAIWSEYDEGYIWLDDGINWETELQKILREGYCDLLSHERAIALEKTRKEIKNKYTVDYVLKVYAQEVNGINNYEEMLCFLKKLLEKQNYSQESELKQELESFFARYKIYEDEYTRFIKLAGDSRYIVEYSEEKEARYYAGIYDENEEFDVECMKKILSMFYDYTYIEGTTRYRPKIERIPFFVRYAKELINELFKKGVLVEIDNEVRFHKVENINDVANKHLFYCDWFKSDLGIAYQKQRLVQKNEKYQKHRSSLRDIILGDIKFFECKNRALRMKYLRSLLVAQLEQGKCNYFYCLNAYQDKNLGVCFLGNTAQTFIDEVWETAKEIKRIKTIRRRIKRKIN